MNKKRETKDWFIIMGFVKLVEMKKTKPLNKLIEKHELLHDTVFDIHNNAFCLAEQIVAENIVSGIIYNE